MGADAFLRRHVDVRPVPGVVGPDLHHRRVERAVVAADGGEAGEVAGVAAVEDAVPGPGHHPGGPQRPGVVAQAAAAEVLPGGGRERQAADARRFVPVQLAQPGGRHAPALQVGADAQRHGEDGVRAGQRPDGGQVEVVVVVVGDDDGVQRQQVGQRHRHRVQPLRPGEGERGAPRAEDGVEQDAVPVDLGEDGGVAQPRQPQAARRGGGAGCRGGGPRPRRRRGGRPPDAVGAAQQLRQHRQHGAGGHGAGGPLVAEGPAAELRRAPHALQALPRGLGAEGRRPRPPRPPAARGCRGGLAGGLASGLVRGGGCGRRRGTRHVGSSWARLTSL